MQRSDIEIQLQLIHDKNCVNDEALIMDEPLRSQGYDSLDEVELFLAVEKEFKINLPDDKLSDLQTPNQLIDLIIFHTHLTEGTEFVAPI